MQGKTVLLERATEVFAAGDSSLLPPVVLKVLDAKISELTLGSFFRNCTHQSGTAERKAMIILSRTWPDIKSAQVLGSVAAAYISVLSLPHLSLEVNELGKDSAFVYFVWPCLSH